MKHAIALVLLTFMQQPLLAEQAAGQSDEMAPLEASDINLSDFLWEKRPVVIFADSPNDPAFVEQMGLLLARPKALDERDVVLLVDTDPAAASDLRKKLRPRGFMLALIGKDGQIKLRKPLPWDVRELTRVIDKMPIRQREIRERRLGDGS